LATVLNMVAQLPAPEARDAFSQMSGDSLSYFQNMGIGNIEMFLSEMNQRSEAAPLMTSSLSPPVRLASAGEVSGLGVQDPSLAKPYGFWSRGIGFWDRKDANASLGSPSARTTTAGFQTGYDHLFGDAVRVGFSQGYFNTSLDVNDRSSMGDATTQQSGVYASYSPAPWFFNASFAYSAASNHMARSIRISSFGEEASSDFDSRAYTTFIEVGHTFKPRTFFSVEPSISLEQIHLTEDAFSEKGAPGLDLRVGDQSLNSFVLAPGIHLSRQFIWSSSRSARFGVSAAWQHDFANVDSIVNAQFIDAPGSVFAVRGTPRDRDSAILGVDARAPLYRSLEGFLNYSSALGSQHTAMTLQGGLSIRW
jgi:outer membrane autotransporter protein